MTFPLAREAVGAAFIGACDAELAALKPGNVHIHAGGHAMEASQFAAAARAASPFISDPHRKLGRRVLGAVDASLAVAHCNTNLGIVLLCTPLAVAAQSPAPAPSPHPSSQWSEGGVRDPCSAEDELRTRLAQVLAGLDRDDAVSVYQAIEHARPAGLGTVDEADVAAPPRVTLREAMALAADRDRIARAYVTDFEDIFAFALPELNAARALAATECDAVTTLHMSLLAEFPDSHIARKHGTAAARNVREEARKRESLWRPVAGPNSFTELLAFDRALKEQGLNPGTTADLVVATLYAAALIALRASKPLVSPLSKDRSSR